VNQAEHRVCLLLGSNIQPEKNLSLAARLLQEQVTLLQVSSVWESHAVGSDGANFLNVALLACTPLQAQALKQRVLHPIEAQLGRVRSVDKNAARTIDLDILLFDGQLLDHNLWQYAFRAVPLAEILPDYASETGESLKSAALRLAHAQPVWVRKDVKINSA
jgi:2-amino-4-hydroxy-6-hydroxymethyldihydropteridine diphosphokinase